MIAAAHHAALASWIGLILLATTWETFLAPLRPGGSLLVLKVVPLLIPLFGLLRERLYSYRVCSLLVLGYFTEGVVRAWSDREPSRSLALAETALAVVFFAACLAYIQLRGRATAR